MTLHGALTAAGVALQVAIAAAIGWTVAQRAVDRLVPAPARAAFGLPERALAALAGFLAFCVGLMLAHVVSGGAVFGSRAPVPLAGAALVVAGVRARAWPRAVPWARVAGAAVVLIALYVGPVLATGSGVRDGDLPWHMGWTEQLLHGEPVPTGPAPELGRNAYPWGFHALAATLVRLVPGTGVITSLEAVHVLVVLCLPLAAACLARRVRPDAGWAAAAAVSLIGGFGWLAARGPEFAASPSEARHGADLVAASPNAVYGLLPPPLPREVGVVALAATALLVVVALAGGGRRVAAAAGVAAGITGLVSVPALVAAVAWTVAACARAGVRGLRLLPWTLGVAGLVFATWAGPVVADYLRFGGFVDITPKLGVEWPVPTALASWGVLAPLALAGLVVAARSRAPTARTLGAFVVAALVLVALSVARSRFGWRLAGNATLLHQGRTWAPAHLLAAALAGVAVAAAFAWAAARARTAAVVGAVVLFAAGAASPVLASVRVAELIRDHRKGFVYTRPALGPGSFVRRAAARLGPDDVVRVEGSNGLAFALFEFSGVRLARYDDDRLDGNDLRIRYADLAARWDARAARGRFDADYVVRHPLLAPPGSEFLVEGVYGHERWVLMRDDQ
ncbi:MAG TPA: hypothetical protein VHJ34_04395 [Actinomycetota bacterium]|nr:hypothetical protein [Actinomycetota bacterium]